MHFFAMFQIFLLFFVIFQILLLYLQTNECVNFIMNVSDDKYHVADGNHDIVNMLLKLINTLTALSRDEVRCNDRHTSL